MKKIALATAILIAATGAFAQDAEGGKAQDKPKHENYKKGHAKKHQGESHKAERKGATPAAPATPAMPAAPAK